MNAPVKPDIFSPGDVSSFSFSSAVQDKLSEVRRVAAELAKWMKDHPGPRNEVAFSITDLEGSQFKLDPISPQGKVLFDHMGIVPSDPDSCSYLARFSLEYFFRQFEETAPRFQAQVTFTSSGLQREGKQIVPARTRIYRIHVPRKTYPPRPGGAFSPKIPSRGLRRRRSELFTQMPTTPP